MKESEIEQLLSALQILAIPVSGDSPVTVQIEDPDDVVYLAAAVEGQASFIVSGDAHLLSIGEFEGIRILKPRAFLDLLSNP